MKLKYLIIIILWCSNLNAVHSQDSLEYTWSEINSFPLNNNEVWAIDVVGNYYFTDRGLIIKYTESGQELFNQSIKSLGKVSQFFPLNTMKLIHFSEEQQSICYFDNTLSSMIACIDLAEQEIYAATLVCASNQPNKIWVLDNVNSRLILLSMNGLYQQQEIKNLKGILNINSISQIIERGNRLFLLDKDKGVYIFDMYGSLLDVIETKEAMHVDAYDNTLFVLSENKLHVFSLNADEELIVDLPKENILEFIYLNRKFYFRTENDVHNYELQFSN